MAIRVAGVNQVLIDQVDFFQGDFFTRVTGLTTSNVTLTFFHNNAQMAWPLVTGVGVVDGAVASGNVYFHEITPVGYYSLRFRPNAVGYWRVVLRYAVGTQTVALDYDVVPTLTTNGILTSFIE